MSDNESSLSDSSPPSSLISAIEKKSRVTWSLASTSPHVASSPVSSIPSSQSTQTERAASQLVTDNQSKEADDEATSTSQIDEQNQATTTASNVDHETEKSEPNIIAG